MTAVVVEHLTKRYGGVCAVDDLSLEIAAGEVFVLIGPNGAGKTTTVEIAEGLRRPDAGVVTVLGSRPGARETAERVGVMPQEGDLYQGIRAEEAVRLFASFYSRAVDPDALLEELGLAGVRRTTYRRLSGGERRRLSLALALVGAPEVAFLDEPTAEMDVEGRARTWEMVARLKQGGTTVVLTTHLLDEASRVADRVGIMRRGRLVAVGSPRVLASPAGSEISFETDRAIDAGALARHIGADVVASADGYRVAGEPSPARVASIAQWLADQGALVRSLRVGARSLEEVYLELTR